METNLVNIFNNKNVSIRRRRGMRGGANVEEIQRLTTENDVLEKKINTCGVTISNINGEIETRKVLKDELLEEMIKLKAESTNLERFPEEFLSENQESIKKRQREISKEYNTLKNTCREYMESIRKLKLNKSNIKKNLETLSEQLKDNEIKINDLLESMTSPSTSPPAPVPHRKPPSHTPSTDDTNAADADAESPSILSQIIGVVTYLPRLALDGAARVTGFGSSKGDAAGDAAVPASTASTPSGTFVPHRKPLPGIPTPGREMIRGPQGMQKGEKNHLGPSAPSATPVAGAGAGVVEGSSEDAGGDLGPIVGNSEECPSTDFFNPGIINPLQRICLPLRLLNDDELIKLASSHKYALFRKHSVVDGKAIPENEDEIQGFGYDEITEKCPITFSIEQMKKLLFKFDKTSRIEIELHGNDPVSGAGPELSINSNELTANNTDLNINNIKFFAIRPEQLIKVRPDGDCGWYSTIYTLYKYYLSNTVQFNTLFGPHYGINYRNKIIPNFLKTTFKYKAGNPEANIFSQSYIDAFKYLIRIEAYREDPRILVEYFGDSFNNIFDKDASQIIKNIKDLCSSIPKFNTRNMYMSEVDFKHITSLYPINFYITETRGRLMLNQDKFNRNPGKLFGRSNYVRLSTLKNVYYNSKNIVSTNIISPFEGDYNNSHKDIAQKTKDDEVIPIFLNFSAGKGIGHYDAIDWDILEETSPLTLNNVVNQNLIPSEYHHKD